MAVVSDQAIAQAAIAAGWPRDQVATAVAVALAESGGDATASTGDKFGLWGIKKADVGTGQWADPTTNAALALGRYKAGGNTFGYWSGNLVKRLAYMARGTIALIEANAGPGNNPLIPDAIEGPADAVGSLAEQAGKGAALLTDRDFWVRAGFFVGGGVLLLVAVFWLMFSLVGTKAIKTTLNVVNPVSKASKAGKAVSK